MDTSAVLFALVEFVLPSKASSHQGDREKKKKKGGIGEYNTS